MTKARRRSWGSLIALAAAVACGPSAVSADPPPPAPAKPAPAPAAPPQATSWEDALQKCMPGAPFAACAAALTAAKLTLRKEDNGDHVELGFNLAPPLAGFSVRTYQDAAGKVATVRVSLVESKGKGRKAVLDWLKGQIGASAKQGRGGGGAVEACGAQGWGVGWGTDRSPDPEVELQLGSPESTSDHDLPEQFKKPEDALLKREGNGVVILCFNLPSKPHSREYVDAPVIAATTLQAFLASPLFHGKAKLP